MSDFQTYECDECAESFRGMPGAKAAENGYCSPVCETASKGL